MAKWVVTQSQSNLHAVDVVMVPDSPEYLVSKSKHKQIIDHFFPKIVINAKYLILSPIGVQCPLKFSRAFEVVAKGFLDLQIHNPSY